MRRSLYCNFYPTFLIATSIKRSVRDWVKKRNFQNWKDVLIEKKFSIPLRKIDVLIMADLSKVRKHHTLMFSLKVTI